MFKAEKYNTFLVNIVILLMTVNFSTSAIFRLQECSKYDAEFSVLQRNKILEGAVLQTHKNIAIGPCQQMCIKNQLCQSINYCGWRKTKDDRYCQLLSKEIGDQGVKLVPKRGCIHVQTPDEYFKKKLGSTCHRLNPCGPAGKCRDTCDGVGYKCIYPVDGQWTEFGPWSSCSVSCGSGTKSRDRNCTNPAPTHDGKNCKGSKTESKTCNMGCCSPASLENGQPMICHDKQMVPICGHWFWNTQYGAQLFCKLLGKSGGKLDKLTTHITQPALCVGQCNKSDKDIKNCTGGGNKKIKTLGGQCVGNSCDIGKAKAITIDCD